MYTIKQNLRPIVEQYNNWINGYYLSGLLQFKGQKQVGGDYISKVFRARAYQIQSRWENAVQTVQNPTYFGFIKDNLCRLVLLNGADRLVTAYQAAPSFNRISRPSTLSFLTTQIMNDGAFRGTLRGLSLNFLQASLVLWPSVLISNKTNGGIVQFMTVYSILDTLLYPLDVVKTKLYANTTTPMNIRTALSQTGIAGAYRGLLFKLIFNVPFAGALYTTATGSEWSSLFWLATALAYPLNTAKVVRQATNGILPVGAGGWRGVLPFVLVNYLCAWQLTALFSKEKLEHLRQEVMAESDQKLGYH